MDAPTPATPSSSEAETTTTEAQQQQQQQQHHTPTLLSGIINGNGAELALLLEACRQLLCMHHAGVGPHIDRPYQQLSQLTQALERGPVPWMDQEEPGRPDLPNPDSTGIRRVTLDQARATVLQALAQCVAIQRRLVTGEPYGPGVGPMLVRKHQPFWC